MEEIVADFVARSRYLLGGTEENNKLSQFNRWLNQDSSRTFSEYKSEVLFQH
jgi:hypothetical protein